MFFPPSLSLDFHSLEEPWCVHSELCRNPNNKPNNPDGRFQLLTGGIPSKHLLSLKSSSPTDCVLHCFKLGNECSHWSACCFVQRADWLLTVFDQSVSAVTMVTIKVTKRQKQEVFVSNPEACHHSPLTASLRSCSFTGNTGSLFHTDCV